MTTKMSYIKYIPGVYHTSKVYTRYIPYIKSIYQVYTRYKNGINLTYDEVIHIYSWYILCPNGYVTGTEKT